MQCGFSSRLSRYTFLHLALLDHRRGFTGQADKPERPGQVSGASWLQVPCYIRQEDHSVQMVEQSGIMPFHSLCNG